jgi:hypothetical protein
MLHGVATRSQTTNRGNLSTLCRVKIVVESLGFTWTKVASKVEFSASLVALGVHLIWNLGFRIQCTGFGDQF